MAKIILYYFPGSHYSQKVVLGLLEKGLAWEPRILNFPNFENYRPHYMRLNPKGVIPTLVCDGEGVAESNEILRYLDSRFPEHSLTPPDAEARARMEKWLMAEAEIAVRELSYGSMSGLLGRLAHFSLFVRRCFIERMMRKAPDLTGPYQAKLDDIARWKAFIQDERNITALKAKIAARLAELNTALEKAPFIAGDAYSLADVVWTAMLARLTLLKFESWWENGRLPALAAYFDRMRARPTFAHAGFHSKLSGMTVLKMIATALFSKGQKDALTLPASS